ncbi:hypothetical protein AKJ09_03563 [Labilithrix luteola]|uniref:Lipoprotein n=1 Tax=Labilithrix luteola TaxID=1391654 RepID=A0A0K1PUT9_9BACT|nr:hypothetical protein AKJ09_03563 [Labilithrix luteola]
MEGVGSRGGDTTCVTPARLAASVLVAISAGCLLLAGSCTVFSGLSVPNDAADDPSPPDSGMTRSEAGSDLPGLIGVSDALKVCSKVLTCPHLGASIAASFGLPIDATNFSECVHVLAGPVDPRRRSAAVGTHLGCIAKIDGCNFGGCTPFEEIDANDPRIDPNCTTGQADRCDGNTRVTCFQSVLAPGGWLTHCSDSVYEPGSQCKVKDGRSWCDIANTTCPSNPTCIDGSQRLSTNDYCRDAGGESAHTKVDCAVIGYECKVAVESCGGPPCSIHLQSQCETDDTSLSVCAFNQTVKVDCAPMGGKCAYHDTTAYCAGPHDECTPYDPAPPDGQGVNSCNGKSIRLCIGGRLTLVDCRQADPGYDCRTGTAPKSNFCGPPI